MLTASVFNCSMGNSLITRIDDSTAISRTNVSSTQHKFAKGFNKDTRCCFCLPPFATKLIISFSPSFSANIYKTSSSSFGFSSVSLKAFPSILAFRLVCSCKPFTVLLSFPVILPSIHGNSSDLILSLPKIFATICNRSVALFLEYISPSLNSSNSNESAASAIVTVSKLIRLFGLLSICSIVEVSRFNYTKYCVLYCVHNAIP
mmetsp:Transcript_25668/g.31548  ORF Transcript_25668/g.31548 Transcript_25668/m.31548 type:complete len:204 (+) Transcript_25668:1720-2331(+)